MYAEPARGQDGQSGGAAEDPQRDRTGLTLVVDLDGTLLRSDMLYESFWTAFGRDWTVVLTAMRALTQGRAALKQRLAETARLETATLPFDREVLAYIRAWREKGGRSALVTASDQSLADAIAGHLGVFDEVHGSDGTRNLKGKAKAAFLADRFGAAQYVYMGDSSADLPVWEQAARAVTVNASQRLRSEAEAIAPEVEHLTTKPVTLRPYVKALRPHQWLKNILVFLPMLAGHQFDPATVFLAMSAFVAYSLVASSVYVVNDMTDLNADRAHPRKKRRPFASGAVPLSHGMIMAPALFLAGAAVSLAVSPVFLAVVCGYFVLTTAYSLNLKRKMVIDICTLAGLYSMRIVAGAVATGIPLSVWLLAFAIFFFLALAAVKRQAELVDSARRGTLHARGRGYNVGDLPIITMIAIAAGYVSVLVLVLYVDSPDVSDLYNAPYMLWGIGAVLLFWITRTIMIAHRGQMHDDPLVFAARDRVSQLCVLLCLGFAVIGAL
ncbi:UbiA family prenyltransferase [Mameliella alba]|uniref:UbiA family prenyltransferase n=1 Tax=Mameliella alba TaxID=561184 RepID=UPI000B5306DC|nr:UbiA family prenyltransferase [Mameliella alba]MBY6118283.1 UbiA family prenyltransferase [Mameliella alba]OWV43435.1 prenyltransferase [Mameliella alba]OWV68572.1 prenyltransferase [Mameliella alba]